MTTAAAAAALDAVFAFDKSSDSSDDEASPTLLPQYAAHPTLHCAGGVVHPPSADADAVMVHLTSVGRAPQVLAAAARFLAHLSQHYYHTAFQQATDDMVQLAHAQERELTAVLTSTAAEAGQDAVVVDDKRTKAIVRRHQGQLREAQDRHAAQKIRAAKDAAVEFARFIASAAADLERHNATREGRARSPPGSTEPTPAHLLAVPLIDFRVPFVEVAQLVLDNPLAGTLVDGTPDTTAPPLLLDVSTLVHLQACLTLPVTPKSGGHGTDEAATVQRLELHLRRLGPSRRHSVLLFLGEWSDFRRIIDAARANTVDAVWPMGELPRDPGPTARPGSCFTLPATNLWGATIACFVDPGTTDGGPHAACDRGDMAPWRCLLQRCVLSAATTWRADMLTVAVGSTLQRDAATIVGAVVRSLGFAVRECSALRAQSAMPFMPISDIGDGSTVRPALVTRQGYALNISVRVFLPFRTLDNAVAVVASAVPGKEVQRRVASAWN